MNNMISTYRLQFHKDFSFREFENIIPYLQKLGIGTIYASPVFHSSAGSTHGYDAMNPHEIDPEIGTEEDLKRISAGLKETGISWLQDIVPNHMAFHPDNPWLRDVLEKGQQSVYFSFFDIIQHDDAQGKRLMVPFLGASLKETIEKKELRLEYQDGRFTLNYYGTTYPLNLRSYQHILSSLNPKNDAVEQLLSQITVIHQVEDAKIYLERWNEFLLQLSSLMKKDVVKNQVNEKLRILNEDPEELLHIAEDQEYRLCSWQETDSRINFRRFFTVNGLICLNIQDENVFRHYHTYIKELSEQGIFQGLRVDHIDGLYDPAGYLEELRKLLGEDTYIVVEKILEPAEDLPGWLVQGSTGYDFLSLVNNLFSNPANEKAFTKFYEKISGSKTGVKQQIHEKKAYILYENMEGELDNLYRLFIGLKLADETDLKFAGAAQLKKALGEVLIHCPVYRYYGNRLPLGQEEAEAFTKLLRSVRKSEKELAPATEVLEKVLIEKPRQGDEEYNRRALSFYQRLMQFTGPLMAKGVEDTLMYTYNRFIGHNEVGDSPGTFGLSADDFHEKMKLRQKQWPLSINGTSTHDTKRGEDVRARLNVLTDLPEEWFETVKLWQYIHSGIRPENKPDANDEYFIYQTLAGAYPMPGQDEDNFETRLLLYLEKAMREAKRHSGWTKPNEEYEQSVKKFASLLLEQDKPFWKQFQNFRRKIVDFGIVNSLAQVLLKFTCPGIPDVYQGCELWDLSLVDPDNRRPVDYEKRQQWLNELETSRLEKQELAGELWQNRYDGKIKLWLTHTLFKERKNEKELFEKAEYIPLQVKGKYKEHILAFARRYKQTWYIVAVPLHLAAMAKEQKKDIGSLKWKGTRVVWPENAPRVWENVLLKTKGKAENEIRIKELFDKVPLGILKLKQPANSRGAGILLHITSLPSPFGIGDFGPEAKTFAGFLTAAKQKYWQILPLSATEAGQGHSPYSAISSMAGNTMLISPELLAEEGLLHARDIKGYHLPAKDTVDFTEAARIKDELFETAYSNFLSGNHRELNKEFLTFCDHEAYWLDSFSLYVTLKLLHQGKPWYEWQEEYKQRDKRALENISDRESYTISKTKWLQFIFMKQWKELKNFCNNGGIQIFGDLPFYVSYDSDDVWSNRDIFCLDAEGRRTGMAGVPPDYFNENGQLWGMPVFRWDTLKAQEYKWWVDRIRKNMELYDVLRLDHFRAFSSYWDVPAGELTAKNGEWKQGPGAGFFEALENKLGKLPFVAEDLGDIDQPVYDLRDQFQFPGMKVLQFAFGDNLPGSIDIPHNYTSNFFVYTGTHDNNTTVGWYHQETDPALRSRIKDYTGLRVTEKNVHKILSRLGYASVANTVILPFQDVIGLDEDHRMNTPSSSSDKNNWSWRMLPRQLKFRYKRRLKKWAELFNRT